jgi:hypothetical protein
VLLAVAFNRTYWEKELHPALCSFYENVFVPAYIDREERRQQGTRCK